MIGYHQARLAKSAEGTKRIPKKSRKLRKSAVPTENIDNVEWPSRSVSFANKVKVREINRSKKNRGKSMENTRGMNSSCNNIACYNHVSSEKPMQPSFQSSYVKTAAST